MGESRAVIKISDSDPIHATLTEVIAEAVFFIPSNHDGGREMTSRLKDRLLRQIERSLARLAREEENESEVLRCVLRIVERIEKQTKQPQVRFDWKVEGPKLKEKRMPLEVSITNEEQIKVHVTPVTLAGKPAKLDGPPAWSVVSGPAKVVAATDGLSADIISDDNDLGDTIILVDADADLGEGKDDVQDTITVHTTHANAKSLGLSADAPTVKP